MKHLLFLLLVAAPALVQAKTVAEVQTAADAILTPLYTGTWRPAEQTYFITNQKFAQCLTTHTAVPQNDDADLSVNETAPDNATAQLHDQTETCDDVLGNLVATTKPYTLWVDVCEGPSVTGSYDDPLSPGRTLNSTYGFLMTVFFEHAGVVYERSQAYGVDSTGAGAQKGCYGGQSADWSVSLPYAPRTGESATGTGSIVDGPTPQAFALIYNCTTGEQWTAAADGTFSITLQIGRQTFLASDAAQTRQRLVSRDVRAGADFNNTISLNEAYSGCP